MRIISLENLVSIVSCLLTVSVGIAQNNLNKVGDIIDYRNNNDSIVDTIYSIKDVDEPYQFLEGEADFLSNIISSIMLENDFDVSSVQSRVYMKFVVEKDGSVSNLDIMNGGYTLSKNILETLNMVKIQPAKRKGEAVRSYTVLPICVYLR